MQKKSIIARYESIQLLNNALVFHLVLVLSKNTKLFNEIKNDEKQIRVVSFKHRHEKSDHLPVFHFSLNLKIFGKIKKQMICDKQNFFLFFNYVLQK